MGVLVRKKKRTGDWYVIARLCNRRCSKKVPNKKTGLKLATKWKKELALGTFEWPNKTLKFSDVLFGKFVPEFLEASYMRLKPSTCKGYKQGIEQHLLPAWKNKYLRGGFPDDEYGTVGQGITKTDVKRLLQAKQEQGLNVNNLRIIISAIFQYAVEREIIETNPAHNLGKLFRDNSVPKTTPQALTKEERDTFLEAAKDSSYHMFYTTLFKTGLRLGEALALAVEDINWSTKQICVQRNLTHKNWGTPKSGKHREVDMSPQLAEDLRTYCLNGRKVCKSSPEKVKLVFCDKKGEPISPDKARVEFHELLKEAGIKRIRLHDCRHSFASILLNAGASLFYVSRQLGHSDIKLTVNLYGHLLPEGREHAILTD